MKNIAKFASPDGTQNLTVSATSGKKGINVKVTVKGIGKTKDVGRAQTGCRHKYESEQEAQKGFDKLVAETKARGWTPVVAQSRNAFVAIPEAPKAKAVKGKAQS